MEQHESLQVTEQSVERGGSDKSTVGRTARDEHRSRFSNEGPHLLLRVWAMSTLILFGFSAVWTLATPIGAANDEPAQLVKAASAARGELLGQTVSPRSVAHLSDADRTSLHDCYIIYGGRRCNRAVTIVTVPEGFASLAACNTFAFVPAGSCVGLRGSARTASAATYVGRYPPLYYAIVGLPSLVWSDDAAVYLMRMVSGMLSALFLGLGGRVGDGMGSDRGSSSWRWR